jgi:hypothetical protein
MVGGAVWESDVARYLRQRGEAAAIVDLIKSVGMNCRFRPWHVAEIAGTGSRVRSRGTRQSKAWRGNVSNRDTKPVVVGSSCRGVQTATLAGSRAGASGTRNSRCTRS